MNIVFHSNVSGSLKDALKAHSPSGGDGHVLMFEKTAEISQAGIMRTSPAAEPSPGDAPAGIPVHSPAPRPGDRRRGCRGHYPAPLARIYVSQPVARGLT